MNIVNRSWKRPLSQDKETIHPRQRKEQQTIRLDKVFGKKDKRAAVVVAASTQFGRNWRSSHRESAKKMSSRNNERSGRGRKRKKHRERMKDNASCTGVQVERREKGERERGVRGAARGSLVECGLILMGTDDKQRKQASSLPGEICLLFPACSRAILTVAYLLPLPLFPLIHLFHLRLPASPRPSGPVERRRAVELPPRSLCLTLSRLHLRPHSRRLTAD